MSDERSPAGSLREALAKMRIELDGAIGFEIARLAGPADATDVSASPMNVPQVATLSGGVRRTDDARLRLDALARHLEGRLKRPKGKGGETKPATSTNEP